MDRDFLLFAGAEVFSGDVQNAIRIDVESDLDLRSSARRGGDAVELEGAEVLVVLGHRALALEDDDFNPGLVVAVSRKSLGLFGRDRGVARNHRGRHIAGRHDSESQRSHIEQEHIADFALEDTALNRGADRDDFIGIHALMRSLPAKSFRDLDDLGHAGHPADEHEFVDFVGGESGVFQAVLERLDAALKKALADLLHFGAAELHIEVLRARSVGRDEGKIDIHGLRGGEGDLGLLRLFLEPLEGHGVFAQIDPVLFFERINQPSDERFVPIISTEMSVTVGGLHLENAISDLEHRDVKRTAT